MPEEKFQEWAILELMGHRRLAGKVSDATKGSGAFLRIDVPSEPPFTQFYSPAAVYAITPTTEETARAIAKDADQPINRWDIHRILLAEKNPHEEGG